MKNIKVLVGLTLMLVLLALGGNAFAEGIIQYTGDLCTDLSKASADNSSSSEYAWRAFDNSLDSADYGNGSSWGAYMPCRIKYDFGQGSEKIIKQYSIKAHNRDLGYCPKDWTFEGSNDGVNWIVLHTVANAPYWSALERRYYTVNNNTAYRYYGIKFTGYQGGHGNTNLIVINEIEMMAEKITTPQAPTNLTVPAGSQAANLSWDAVTGATSYNVKRATTVGGPYSTIASNITTTSYTDTTTTTGTYYYVVTAVNAGGESVNSNEVSTSISALTLDIEALNYKVRGNTEFDTYVIINGANSIYAEDINIQYDSNLFQYLGADTVNPTGLGIYHKSDSTPGTARYIVASKGEEYGLNGKVQILKLRFKAKNLAAQGEIKVTTGKVADGNGVEYDAACSGKTFEISTADVNNDGRYSLGDLAIAGRLFGTQQTAWGVYKPDVDVNGGVDDVDLSNIVNEILAN